MADQSCIVDIGQPDNWFGHYDALDERHFKYGERYPNGGRQCTDLGEHLSEMRITADLETIRADDFLPYEEAKPHLMQYKVQFPLKPDTNDGAHSIVLVWVSTFNTWIALRQGREKCPFCDFEGERYKSAFSPSEYCCKKISEAFSIPEGIVSVEEVRHTKPEDLRLMGEYKSRFVTITFERGYYDHYDPDPLEVLKIPVEGTLPHIPEDIRRGYIEPEKVEVTRRPMEEPAQTPGSNLLRYPPFTERIGEYAIGAVEFNMKGRRNHLIQLRWVKERNEWIAAAYGMEGFTDHAEWYDGPFSLDDYCIERLMQAYGLTPGRLSQQECVRTVPSELERIASQR